METIKNRNQSFFEILEKLPSKSQLILQCYKENPRATAQEISQKYFIPINEVVARTNELEKACLIKVVGSKVNPYTNKQNTAYDVILNSDERINLVNKRYQILIDKRDNLINDYNLHLSPFSKEVLTREVNKIKKEIMNLELSSN